MKLNYFNFKEFKESILMTNDFGSYIFVTKEEFRAILKKKVDLNSKLGRALLAKKMVYDETDLEYTSKYMYDIRRIKGYVNSSTSLHIFVVTTACNQKCIYCQANNGKDFTPITMSKETAEKAVDIALQSPSRFLNFEFQGGEPLLNFEIIKHIISYAEANKGKHEITYNIVTNLTLITDEILEYFVQNKVDISTSLDGPEFVHNSNRPFQNGQGTFETVVKALERIKEKGMKVGAIQTTTRASLPYPKEIVRTYQKLGFDNIFLRPLTPLGKASKNWDEIGYTPGEFNQFYHSAVEEIIEINKAGEFFQEQHASILLKKIDGQFVNYMELRSPCGAGIGQMAYYPNGEVFTCDEGRMLYEMGDPAFRLGNVYDSTFNDLIKNGVCKTVCASSILESVPVCADCVYQPYCGTCPVVSYAMSSDVLEKTPRGYRCKVYSAILDFIFERIYEADEFSVELFKSWSN